MQNLKYMEKVIDEEHRFCVILNEFAMKHESQIQKKIALSLLEYFNGGKFVDENDINQEGGTIFFVLKGKYFTPPKSKIFSIRVNLDSSEEEINIKISELKRKIKRYQNSQ